MPVHEVQEPLVVWDLRAHLALRPLGYTGPKVHHRMETSREERSDLGPLQVVDRAPNHTAKGPDDLRWDTTLQLGLLGVRDVSVAHEVGDKDGRTRGGPSAMTRGTG